MIIDLIVEFLRINNDTFFKQYLSESILFKRLFSKQVQKDETYVVSSSNIYDMFFLEVESS
jgi:hypothetical protein